MTKLDSIVSFLSPRDMHGPFKYSMIMHLALLLCLIIGPIFLNSNKIYRGAGVHTVNLVSIPNIGKPQGSPAVKETRPAEQPKPKEQPKKTETVAKPKVTQPKPAAKPLTKPAITVPKPLTTPDLKERLAKKLEQKEKTETKDNPADKKEWVDPTENPSVIENRNTQKTSTINTDNGITIDVGGDSNGGASGGGGDNSPFAYYIDLIQTKITSCWIQPKMVLDKDYISVVSFTIMQSGEVTGIFVKKGSGIKEFDDSGTKAIENAKPFPPLPIGFGSSQLTVNVEFSLD